MVKYFLMKQDSDITPEDFVTRNDFIEWVLKPTPESDRHWKQFLLDHPSCEKEIREAAFIIKGIVPEEKKLDKIRLEKLWTSIARKTTRKALVRRLPRWSVAAGLMVLLGISSLFYFMINHGSSSFDYQSVMRTQGNDNKIKLVFADDSERTFDSKSVDIRYKNTGEIEVDADGGKTSTAYIQSSGEKDATKSKTLFPSSGNRVKEKLNQLIVPRGKRTSLTLSDGTKLCLNSGSRAVFPATFSNEKRELFIEGEAYVEVAHDSKRPFVVLTESLSVRVLGTKFDISAYPEDSYSSVVLVEGSVQAEINAQKIKMNPNHLLVYQKRERATSLEKTDVLPYISWKDGWLHCNREKLGVIAGKLARYYNVEIEIKDQSVADMPLNGKLDLKSECSEIFRAISSIAPVSCEITEDKIILRKK